MIDRDKKRNKWILKIQELYPEMKATAIRMAKSSKKCTYEELYEIYKEKQYVMLEIQDALIEYDPVDLNKLQAFAGKNPGHTNRFISFIYCSRERLPRDTFINKCKEVLEELNNEKAS